MRDHAPAPPATIVLRSTTIPDHTMAVGHGTCYLFHVNIIQRIHLQESPKSSGGLLYMCIYIYMYISCIHIIYLMSIYVIYLSFCEKCETFPAFWGPPKLGPRAQQAQQSRSQSRSRPIGDPTSVVSGQKEEPQRTNNGSVNKNKYFPEN